MSVCVHSTLSWLPLAPEGYKDTVKSLTIEEKDLGSTLSNLATHRLDLSQLSRLAKHVKRLKAEGASFAPLTHFKLGIVGNITTEFLPSALIATALRHGIDLEIHETPFNTMIPECLNAQSGLNTAKCDAVLFLVDYRQLPVNFVLGDDEGSKIAVSECLAQFVQLRDALNKNRPTVCLFTTLVPPLENMFGSIDKSQAGTAKKFIYDFNARLFEHCQKSEDVIIDQASLAETIGLSHWHDPVMWHMSKLPFSMRLIPTYADFIMRHIGALQGKSRKVLILDLDNTLWGGVIGDDGVEGIQIGNGSPIGEAYLNIQKTVLSLRDRGIVLAVCSKNNDDVARLPFQKHPDMILKEEHISVFQANWNDKASNIQAIADHLSLGLDSFVFLDDNPAERARVRQMLPQVAVPEVPPEPELYVRTLMAAGYFESIVFLDEDKKRADYYDSNAKRITLKNTLGDFETYLKSLEMTLHFSPFDDINRARISQLVNKSNQFNLTTRRYSESDIKAFENNPSIFTVQARLEDSFGDNGMIGVVICRSPENNVWEIDTWLMSCRVLERQIEAATLDELIRHARQNDIKTIRGVYIETDRNALVKDHYKKLGFTKADKDGVWVLDIEDYAPPIHPMTIQRSGFSSVKISATG